MEWVLCSRCNHGGVVIVVVYDDFGFDCRWKLGWQDCDAYGAGRSWKRGCEGTRTKMGDSCSRVIWLWQLSSSGWSKHSMPQECEFRYQKGCCSWHLGLGFCVRFDTGETSVTFNSNQQNFYRTLLLLSVCSMRFHILECLNFFWRSKALSVVVLVFSSTTPSVGQFNFSGLLIFMPVTWFCLVWSLQRPS